MKLIIKIIKNTGTPNNSAKGFNIRSYTKGATYAQINATANSEIKAYENTLCNILLIPILYPFYSNSLQIILATYLSKFY